ncbi:MAG: flagellin [Blautia sp.]|nr:flagellin [Blautia sp.]
MKINRNMSAVITNNQMLRTENRLTASMERLSSGLKINSAGDNPAGMAISNKMKAQIDALDQAQSNATDGKSVLQIADGALNEVSSMLQRMRELSVQAANGTNSYNDRKSIQAEIDKLTEEVDRISSDTEYNTKALLDGSSDVRVYSREATRLAVSDRVLPDMYNLTVNAPAEKGRFTLPAPSTSSVSGTVTINDVTYEYYKGMDEEAFYEQLRQAAEQAGCTAVRADDGSYTLETGEYGSNAEMVIEVSKSLAESMGMADGVDGVSFNKETGSYEVKKAGRDADVTLDTTDGFSKSATALVDGCRVKVTDVGGFSMDFLLNEPVAEGNVTTFEASVSIEVTDIGAMTIQIGANQYQEMDVRIPEVSSESLYLDKVDVTVKKGPEKALNTLDDAIATLNEVRSRIGAFQNRLEYAASSLAETEEDMTAAYSNILDTDMAEEMTEYTQQSVLDQASISVLSQANDIPQQILSLLQ